tara:strand:+ start:35 stop:637 length:603 start_codon:yes stop_codon:yes gene_type:complete
MDSKKNQISQLLDQQEEKFFNDYWDTYKRILFKSKDNEKFVQIKKVFKQVSQDGGKIIFVGNGASASLASHAATDLTKQGKIKSIALNDHNLITALSNDYGYEKWVEKALSYYSSEKDMLVLISVSGESPNLINALNYAKKNSLITLSITGSCKENTLRTSTDYSLWVDSKSYNVVESIHTIWVTLIIDLIIGKSQYSVN